MSKTTQVISGISQFTPYYNLLVHTSPLMDANIYFPWKYCECRKNYEESCGTKAKTCIEAKGFIACKFIFLEVKAEMFCVAFQYFKTYSSYLICSSSIF